MALRAGCPGSEQGWVLAFSVSIWTVVMVLNGIKLRGLESRMGHRVIPEEMKPGALTMLLLYAAPLLKAWGCVHQNQKVRDVCLQGLM